MEKERVDGFESMGLVERELDRESEREAKKIEKKRSLSSLRVPSSGTRQKRAPHSTSVCPFLLLPPHADPRARRAAFSHGGGARAEQQQQWQ